MVAGSPPINRPLVSNFESRAGSSAPSEALVGVISQPPSGSRTLMLPVDPKVRPRWKIESPTAQISSRDLASPLIVVLLVAVVTVMPAKAVRESGHPDLRRVRGLWISRIRGPHTRE